MPVSQWVDATAQAELVRSGEAGPGGLAGAAISRIEAVNPELDAVIRTRFDEARFQAARLEADGDLCGGRFCGVPILFKELGRVVQGEPTSFAVRPLRDPKVPATADLPVNYRPPRSIPLTAPT